MQALGECNGVDDVRGPAESKHKCWMQKFVRGDKRNEVEWQQVVVVRKRMLVNGRQE